jgi:serine/threonine-protein kinase
MITFEELRRQFSSFCEKPLAEGGQKKVYRAEHPVYGSVAVKVLNHYDERAQREVEIAQKNNFQHVPLIYDVQSVLKDGCETVVIIEQFIIGTDLREVIRSGKEYSLFEAADFLQQSLMFISEISKKNIVHRDIKPENIIVSPDGELYFLDFGIARVLDATSITKTNQGGPNTPGYAAPEQFTGQKEHLDTRADLFSIGVVTYELVTGVNPFRKNARSPYEVLNNTVTVTPVQHQIEGDVQSQFMGLISTLMSKQVFLRPQTADKALEWLKSARETFTVSDGA